MAVSHRERERHWIEIPTGEVQLVAPGHRADWPRRGEVVPNLERRATEARRTGQWPGEPIRVRRQGESYVLVSGFARLAVAVEAGLPAVRAVVLADIQEVPLAEIHLRPWQEKAWLNPQKLAQRQEEAARLGTLPLPLQIRPARMQEPPGYTLADGLYWYHVARALGWEKVPVVILDTGEN